MTDRNLTRVEIEFYPGYVNNRLRFGKPDRLVELDKRRAIALFSPGQVFGYVRWCTSEFGTEDWRLTVMEAQEPSLLLSRVPGVRPGAEVLLLMTGKARVKRILGLLDALEARGFALEDVSPSYYRHLHIRLSAGRPIRPYACDQHTAHLAARRVR